MKSESKVLTVTSENKMFSLKSESKILTMKSESETKWTKRGVLIKEFAP